MKAGIEWDKERLRSKGIMGLFKPTAQRSRPGTAHSTLSTGSNTSIHAYKQVRQQLRVATKDIDTNVQSEMLEILDKMQFTLSIAESEQDAYREALNTEQGKRQRSKPLATAEFEKEHGKINVQDKEKFALKKAFEAGLQHHKDVEELKKAREKETKAKAKEQQQILNEQRKYDIAEQRLQKKNQKDYKAEQKRAAAAQKKEDLAAQRQLKADQKQAEKL